MDREGLSGFELIVLVVGGAAAVLIGVVWAGATIAIAVSGRAVVVPIADAASAMGELPSKAGDPAAAWPPPIDGELPGPLVYWPSTAVAALVVPGAAAGGLRALGGSGVGTARRRVLGVNA